MKAGENCGVMFSGALEENLSKVNLKLKRK
jgi:hypothetical protein